MAEYEVKSLIDIEYFPVQKMAADSQADILLFGGAAGGSKTWLLLLLALKAHRRAIIFRREFSQLRQIIDDSKKLIGEKGRFNGSSMIWQLPNNRLLEFGGVKDFGDERKYQGRAHDLKAFDELPEFSEQQFRFLIGWTRTDNLSQRCRVVAAGNPPLTADGEWIIRFWAPWLDSQHERPAKPGELRWYAMVDEKEIEVETGKPFTFKGETITPKSRTFIPARVEDNPVYMASGYKTTLQALPEPLRSAMLHGKFDIKKDEDPWQVIPREWVRAAQERWKNTPRPSIPMTGLGVDCARGGKDKTVLSPLYGNWFDEQKTFLGVQTPDGQSIAALIIAVCNGQQPNVNIDVIGIGASAYDNVKHSVNTTPVNVAEHSEWLDKSGKLKMANQRAEMYWSFREALDPVSGKELALPPDKELENDLCAAKWELRSNGIIIKSKEEITARLGRSPDKGESAMLAYFRSYLAPPSAIVTKPKSGQFIRRGIGL